MFTAASVVKPVEADEPWMIFGEGDSSPPQGATPPTIEVINFQNGQTFLANNITLNIIVKATYKDTNYGASWIESIQYRGDWQKENTTIYEDKESQQEIVNLTFTIHDVPRGSHNLVISTVEGGKYYSVIAIYYYKTNFAMANSVTINFDMKSEPAPFSYPSAILVLIVILATILSASLTLLFLRKKHKKNKLTQ
jgi:hypothetical protein